MAKVFKKCGICLDHEAIEIYFPFRSENQFSHKREDIDAEDSIQICRQCEYMIFQIRRCNVEAFSEAVTIGDFAAVVRKVYKL